VQQGPVYMAGNSLGGYLAVMVASRRPELVKGLFLMNPTYAVFCSVCVCVCVCVCLCCTILRVRASTHTHTHTHTRTHTHTHTHTIQR